MGPNEGLRFDLGHLLYFHDCRVVPVSVMQILPRNWQKNTFSKKFEQIMSTNLGEYINIRMVPMLLRNEGNEMNESWKT